jgi:hypothetical protein
VHGVTRGGETLGRAASHTWVRPASPSKQQSQLPLAVGGASITAPVAKRRRVDVPASGTLVAARRSKSWTRTTSATLDGQDTPPVPALAAPVQRASPAVKATKHTAAGAALRRTSPRLTTVPIIQRGRMSAPVAALRARNGYKPPTRGKLVVRRLVGQQNCEVLYRKTGRHGQQLTRTGVRGGRGGANLTWVAPTQPKLRAAAVAAVKRAERAAAVEATASQALAPVMLLGKRKRLSAVRRSDAQSGGRKKASRLKGLKGRVGASCKAVPPPLRLKPLCLAFCRTGRCPKPVGQCPLRHDPDTVAICVHWLSGTCVRGEDCPLQHHVHPARMPVCTFFLEGRCTSAACPYLHVNVSPEAAVCTAFAQGYCARGASCTLRHALTCPAGAACPNRAVCRLHHPVVSKPSAPAKQVPVKSNVGHRMRGIGADGSPIMRPSRRESLQTRKRSLSREPTP